MPANEPRGRFSARLKSLAGNKQCSLPGKRERHMSCYAESCVMSQLLGCQLPPVCDPSIAKTLNPKPHKREYTLNHELQTVRVFSLDET
jgi:hypothetical protein